MRTAENWITGSFFYWDEVGTIPKIESAEMMFSASRSRKVSIVPMIQSFAQLNKNYGKEGAEIIIDNCQDTIFGGFARIRNPQKCCQKASATGRYCQVPSAGEKTIRASRSR